MLEFSYLLHSLSSAQKRWGFVLMAVLSAMLGIRPVTEPRPGSVFWGERLQRQEVNYTGVKTS